MHEVEPTKGLKSREICPVEGCNGAANYFPPGKGHMDGCYYPFGSQAAKDAALVAAERTQDDFEPVVLEAEPSEESRIIIAMLMRIYDVQMALLTKVDPENADRIYDAHEAGETFNPTIYIPEVNDVQEEA